MMPSRRAYVGGLIFDGHQVHDGLAARFVDGSFEKLVPAKFLGSNDQTVDLKGTILCPGYVDLQVNGGDGVMFNDDPSVNTLTRIAQAHYHLGTRWLLPTLITDTPEKTLLAIDATIEAIAADVPGIAGLHLEGPHLSIERKGAHDPKLIRPMTEVDLLALVAAARDLPILKVTIAPESVNLDQVKRMHDAGIIVSLGHTDADFETCMAYAEAGARCVTHLFNAMSQIGNRDPGLVGAALYSEHLSAGLIADGIHVHKANIQTAWRAKLESKKLFLVSDAMAVAGTNLTSFELEGRRIERRDNRLTLADGTLAGADLELTTALSVLSNSTNLKLGDVLSAAITNPGKVIGLFPGSNRLTGLNEDQFIQIEPDLSNQVALNTDRYKMPHLRQANAR